MLLVYREALLLLGLCLPYMVVEEVALVFPVQLVTGGMVLPRKQLPALAPLQGLVLAALLVQLVVVAYRVEGLLVEPRYFPWVLLVLGVVL